ncbi:hypothetical protein [Desulfothermus sp.]
MLPGETIHSMLPQDLPWWRPDHAIFFGVVYIILMVIGSGVGLVTFKSLLEVLKEKNK